MTKYRFINAGLYQPEDMHRRGTPYVHPKLGLKIAVGEREKVVFIEIAPDEALRIAAELIQGFQRMEATK